MRLKTGITMTTLDDLPEFDRGSDATFREAHEMCMALSETRRVELAFTSADGPGPPVELRAWSTAGAVLDAFTQVVTLIHVEGHGATSTPLANSVLTVTARGDALEFSLDTRPGTVVIRRDVALAAWDTTLSALVDSMLGRLRRFARAQAMFACRWAAAQELFVSGRAWYANAEKLALVFPHHAPPRQPHATLSGFLREAINFDVAVGLTDRNRIRESATAHWIGGDAPKETLPLQMRLALWQGSAPVGGQLWCVDGARLAVVEKKARGAVVFIDTFARGRERPLDSLALMRNRLQRHLFLSSSFEDAFVMDHGDIRPAS